VKQRRAVGRASRWLSSWAGGWHARLVVLSDWRWQGAEIRTRQVALTHLLQSPAGGQLPSPPHTTLPSTSPPPSVTLWKPLAVQRQAY